MSQDTLMFFLGYFTATLVMMLLSMCSNRRK